MPRSTLVVRTASILVVAVVLSVSNSLASTASVLDGAVDRSFGTAGIAGLPGVESTSITGIGMQTSGKIVVAGFHSSLGWVQGWNFHAARFDAAGTLDPSFGTNGVFDLNIGFGHDVARDMLVQADGKILIGGDIEYRGPADYRVTVVRLTTSGALDTTFGNSGIWIDPRGAGTVFTGMALDQSGNVLIAGRNFGAPNAFVGRINPAGVVDSTFGADGFSVLSDSTGLKDPKSVAVDSRGSVIVGGSNGGHFMVMRLTSRGTPDDTFGVGGMASTPVGSTEATGSKVIPTAGGYVLLGTASLFPSAKAAFSLARFTLAGALDSTFGDSGVTQSTPDSAFSSVLRGGVVSSDGTIYATGFQKILSGTVSQVAAFSPEGVALDSFGLNGFSAGCSGSYLAAALQSDGQVLAGGSCDAPGGGSFALQRYVTSAREKGADGIGTPSSVLAHTGLRVNELLAGAFLLLALGTAAKRRRRTE